MTSARTITLGEQVTCAVTYCWAVYQLLALTARETELRLCPPLVGLGLLLMQPVAYDPQASYRIIHNSGLL
jgi:hypothetical protein